MLFINSCRHLTNNCNFISLNTHSSYVLRITGNGIFVNIYRKRSLLRLYPRHSKNKTAKQRQTRNFQLLPIHIDQLKPSSFCRFFLPRKIFAPPERSRSRCSRAFVCARFAPTARCCCCIAEKLLQRV